MTKKQCSKCKRILDHSEFSKDKSRKDGLYLWCKECDSRYHKEKYMLLKREVIDAFGGRCSYVDKHGVRCSKNSVNDLKDLELSHPNGDGDAHRSLISNGRTGSSFYRALKKQNWNTDGFDVVVMCKSHHHSLDKTGQKHPLYKEGNHNNSVWLRKRYVDDVMTLQEIADKCGTDASLIWRRMIKFNIHRRKPGKRP